MNPVLRFSLLYACVLAIMLALAILGLGATAPVVQPLLVVFAAWASGARGAIAVFQMTLALVVINLVLTLGFAGPAVLPGLWREFTSAPVLLTLWMLSSLIIPALLIAGGVWLRHITAEIRRRRR